VSTVVDNKAIGVAPVVLVSLFMSLVVHFAMMDLSSRYKQGIVWMVRRIGLPSSLLCLGKGNTNENENGSNNGNDNDSKNGVEEVEDVDVDGSVDDKENLRKSLRHYKEQLRKKDEQLRRKDEQMRKQDEQLQKKEEEKDRVEKEKDILRQEKERAEEENVGLRQRIKRMLPAMPSSDDVVNTSTGSSTSNPLFARL
jgi:hypothetical protein